MPNAPEKKVTRLGILVVHGIGEQMRFEHLEQFAGNLVNALRHDSGRRVQVQVRRGGHAPRHSPTESWRDVPVIVSWRHGAADVERWTEAHFREVNWADLDLPLTTFNWLRLVGWALGMPGVKRIKTTRTRAARDAYVCSPRELSWKEETFVRAQLFVSSLLFLLMLISIGLPYVLLQRLSLQATWLRNMVGTIYDYLGDIKLYQDWSVRDDENLEAIGGKSRAAIRRRAVRALVYMARDAREGRLDAYYVFAHSLGSVIAFNALMELGVALPNYFTKEEWEELIPQFGCQAPRDAPADQMPIRPYWLGARDAFDRQALFEYLSGVLTMGSSLNTDAKLRPALVPVNKERLRRHVPWVNVVDRLDLFADARIALFESCDRKSDTVSPHDTNTRLAEECDIAGFQLRNVEWADRLLYFAAHASYWEALRPTSNLLDRFIAWLTGKNRERLIDRLIPWLESGDIGAFRPPLDRYPSWLASPILWLTLSLLVLVFLYIPAVFYLTAERLSSEASGSALWPTLRNVALHSWQKLVWAMVVFLAIGAGIVLVCSVVRCVWEQTRHWWFRD